MIRVGNDIGSAVGVLLRHPSRRVGLIVLLVGQTACAGGEKIEVLSADDTLKAVVAEMKLVAPMIKGEHFKECTAVLEKESILGAKYQAVGEPQPSEIASCFAQGRAPGSISVQNNRKSIGYRVALTKVAGVYGTGSPHKSGYCYFDVLDGKVTYRPAPTMMSIYAMCVGAP